jgi:hypothetical protein
MSLWTAKEFREVLTEVTPKALSNYLSGELAKSLRDLQGAFRKLTLADNFESFEVTVTIAAGAEQPIRNELRKVVPTKRLVVRGGENSHLVVDGPTTWTQDYVYLKNFHASALTVTVVFFR